MKLELQFLIGKDEVSSNLKWKNNVEHTEARNRGREQWYKQYQLRICKVEREYGFVK